MTGTQITFSFIVFAILIAINFVLLFFLKKQIRQEKIKTSDELGKKLEASVDEKGLTIRSNQNEIFIKTTKLLK